MIGASARDIRRWESDPHSIPTDRLATLGAAEEALDRLLEMFLPERLPQVIRRKAALFEERPALDWILEGRIGEVATRYDLALTFQA
jgi:hypothetical protein